MDKIHKITSFINGIVEVYSDEDFQSELKNTTDTICNKLSALIDKNGGAYDLVSSNSVRPLRYYSVDGRVKERASFHEKMIRGNLVYNFLDKKRYKSRKQILNDHVHARKIIKEVVDDIIGIKILTEVEADCKKIHRLLEDIYSIALNDKSDIYLEIEDLKSQPIKMRNGLEFYKIKGVYASTFKFELQIKSKLLSVWGDMDHSIFYKDYSVSPIKENVRNSMNHLGILITQVDKFLLQIREATTTFSKSRKVVDFIEHFSTNYSPILEKKLGFGYRLDEIVEFLFYLFELPNRKEKKVFNYDYLKYKHSDSTISHYIGLRNKSFNLQIIELVYYNWFGSTRLTPNTFDTTIRKFLDEVRAFHLSKISDKNDEVSQLIAEHLLKNIPFLKQGAVLYNSDMINDFAELYRVFCSYSDIEIHYANFDERSLFAMFLLLIFLQRDCTIFIQHYRIDERRDVFVGILTSLKFPYENIAMTELSKYKSVESLKNKCLDALKDL
jgi:ppGpp synthetase/RelA/SpoT-type nucleotidyltranferase